MNIITILKIIALILQLIASGLSEGEAVGTASAIFDIPENIIRNFL